MEIIRYKDGNGYVAKDINNKHKRVMHEQRATRFEDGTASNFIQNCVQKLFRDRMEIIKIDNLSNETPTSNNSTPDDKTLNVNANSSNCKNFSITHTPFDSLDFDWCSKLRQEDEFRKNLDIYKHNLPIMLSKIDSEICDVEHYIEFNKFSASEGYMLCRLLKEKRETRRKIKNEMEILDAIYRDWLDGQNAKNIYNLIDRMAKRSYEPRVLKNLF